ncbi:MAG TPA: TolC family protein [Polyangiaceae bacterium]|nr:TolC family protein [Polyangiaceae bacterium]
MATGRRFASILVPGLLVLNCISRSALGQVNTAPMPPAGQAGKPAANPAPNAGQATSESAAPAAGAEPTLPKLEDPMLVPPPAAQQTLSTWQQALTILRQNSTALKSSRARIQQATAQRRLALAPALPTLTANGTATQHLLTGEGCTTINPGTTEAATVCGKIPNPSGYYVAGLNLRVPVLAPRAWYDQATARDVIENSKLDQKDVERREIARVAATIVNVVTQERLAEVSRVALSSALTTLDLSRRRAALGAASRIDVLRIEQEVSDSRAQVVAATENLLRSREELGNALSSSEPYGITPDIRLDNLAEQAAGVCQREANVELRPDVRAASAATHVAERNIKSVDYAFIPTLDGVSTLSYASTPLRSENREHVSWTIGAVLTWQIYDGGVRYGTRDARRADLELSQQNLSDVRRRATIEIRQALRGLTVAQQNLEVAQKARDLAAETARLTRIAYLNGTGTSFDLVDSARRLRSAELDLANRELSVLQSKLTALLALATCKV